MSTSLPPRERKDEEKEGFLAMMIAGRGRDRVVETNKIHRLRLRGGGEGGLDVAETE